MSPYEKKKKGTRVEGGDRGCKMVQWVKVIVYNQGSVMETYIIKRETDFCKLRKFDVFPEDSDLVPSTQLVAHNHQLSVNNSSKDLTPSLASLDPAHTWYKYI